MTADDIAKARAAGKAMTELPEHFWESLYHAAIMPAWHARKQFTYDEVNNSDARAHAAVQGVRDRLAGWAAEEDE